jgi:hypothetical protein
MTTRSPREIAADLASLARELEGAGDIDITVQQARFFKELARRVGGAARWLHTYVSEQETDARASAGWTIEVLRGDQWEVWWAPGLGPVVGESKEEVEEVVEELLQMKLDAVWRAVRCELDRW